MGEWIVDVISFQKIFGFCGLKGHIVEIWRDVTLVDNERRTTECEDRARILGTRIRNLFRVVRVLSPSRPYQAPTSQTKESTR